MEAAEMWKKELGVSDYFVKILREGIHDIPSRQEWEKEDMPAIL